MDSQAVLKAVQCVLRLGLMWVPSHVGVLGNEWADIEANAAAGKATSSSSYFPALPPSSLGESRRAGVLLAQLRFGHRVRLAAYGRIVNPLSDPSCSLCQEAELQDLEHLFQRCSTLAARRRASFGTSSPPLSVLVRVRVRVRVRVTVTVRG